MKNVLLFLCIWVLQIGVFTSSVQSQNHCLDLDGVDDQIRISTPGLIPANSESTLETWFLSENGNDCSTNTPTYFNILFSLSGGSQPVVNFGMCDDVLYLQTGTGSAIPVANGLSNSVWYHLALRVDGPGNLDIFLDGILTYSSPGYSLLGYDNLSFGENESPAVAGILDHWKGKIDEIRLWNIARTEPEINASRHCPCLGNEPGAVICMPLDEGTPAGDNTTLTGSIDEAPLLGANDADLQDFTLNGSTSNFVESEAGLIYPVYEDLALEINDYFNPTTVLTEICTGDPVRFCLSQNGNIPQSPEIVAPGANVQGNVTWQFIDNTVTDFTDIPSFQGFCFPVGPGIITGDCSSNSDGFVDRQYRVKIEVVESVDINDVCTYYSDPVNLRICCPISPATVDVTTNFPDDLLCAGDEVDFSITLNSPDDFVTTPGQDVTIEWSYNGTPISFSNQTNFNYNNIIVDEPEACFSVVVTNCGGKTETFQKCFTVDPIPTCGDIIGLSSNLNLVTSSPLLYEICSGEDAQITMVDPADFTNGIISWEYMFPSVGSWIQLGVSNSIQNTNVLSQDGPPGSIYEWPPMETCIVYRAVVSPLSTPSGCEPCYSNELEICLTTEPTPGIIAGTTPICSEDLSTPFSVQSPNSDYTYNWVWNGAPTGSGTGISADMAGTYVLETSNGCQTTTSEFELEVCEVTAVISCPLAPNPCACKGVEIELSGEGSLDSCGENLSYEWSADDGMTGTGPFFSHTPNGPTTYTLKVKNEITGCSNTTTRTIKPCLKNE